MGRRDARAAGVLWAVVVAVGFASCGGEGGGSADAGAGAGGEPQLHDGGKSSVAGAESQAGAGAGGRVTTLGGAGGGAGAGQGGLGGGGSGAGQGGLGGGGASDCPAPATVECDEIVAGASYDAPSSTLTLQLPGRVEVEVASLGVTFLYANGDPEDYADVAGTIEGDTLTFDFSAYEGSGISYLSAEPTLVDSCGDNVNVHAPGLGFGPAIMIDLEHSQGAGGAGGAGNVPNIVCGHTN